MKYFESYEILFGLVTISLYGGLCGALYHSARDIVYALFLLLRLPGDAIASKYRKNKNSSVFSRQKSKFANIYDFVFVIFCGALYIVFSYILFDGVVRLFPLVSYFISLFFFCKTLGVAFSCAFKKLFGAFYLGAFNFLFYVFRPLNFTLRLLHKGIYLTFNFLKLRLMRRRSLRLAEKKLAAIEHYFKAAS